MKSPSYSAVHRVFLAMSMVTFHLLNLLKPWGLVKLPRTLFEGHFTHETESPWPSHFKHSHWWKRRSQSKFASHYAWGTNKVCECEMDVKSTYILCMTSNGSCFMVTYIIFKNHLLEVGLTQKPGDHGTRKAHSRWVILFYHVWEPAWIETHWNGTWLRARSHMASHYTWESVTTLHDVGGVLGRPLDNFFWALTISWSQLLARVWSGPEPFWVNTNYQTL